MYSRGASVGGIQRKVIKSKGCEDINLATTKKTKQEEKSMRATKNIYIREDEKGFKVLNNGEVVERFSNVWQATKTAIKLGHELKKDIYIRTNYENSKIDIVGFWYK